MRRYISGFTEEINEKIYIWIYSTEVINEKIYVYGNTEEINEKIDISG